MNVALVVITDRGDLYLPRMLESLKRFAPFEFSQRITIDDQAHELGLSGAVNAAWEQLGADVDYVFHMEEDFVLLEDVRLARMCRTLAENPNLAQLVLQRQFEPTHSVEVEAGSVISPLLGPIVEHAGWLEQSAVFSLNPCVYPASITRDGWPLGHGESEFTARMLAEGRTFGFWGVRRQPPAVMHVGSLRATGWHV